MKVLIIYSGSFSDKKPGGIRSYIERFIAKFSKDHHIDLVTVDYEGEDKHIVSFSSWGGKYKIIGFLFDACRYFGSCKEHYDCVVFNRPEEAILVPFVKAQKKVLLVHGSVKYGYTTWPLVFAIVSDILERLVVTFLIDKLFVLLKNREYGVGYYQTRYWYVKEKIEYLPVPLDDRIFEIRQKEHIPKHLIYFGRLVENPKRISYLINAFVYLHSKDQDYRLVLIGDGPDKAKIQNIVRERNLDKLINILPSLNGTDLYREVSKNKIFLNASNFEGICLSAVEAICLGLKVVATDVGDLSEYVWPQNGVLVKKSASIKSFCQAIEKAVLINDTNDLNAIQDYYPDRAFEPLIAFIKSEKGI